MKKNNRSVRIAVLVSLCFFLPFLGAYFVFVYHDKLHLSQTNKGTLIEPLIKASSLNVTFNKSQDFSWHDTKKHWTLMYLTTECVDNKLVATNLSQLSHMHAAMGRDDIRLKMLFVLPSYCHIDRFVIHYKKAYPDFKFGTLPVHRLVKLQAQLAHKNGYFMLDPLQNIMMYYTTGTSVLAIYSDIKQLLKVSQIG